LTGNLPNCQNIETEKVMEAFSFDKKNVGNALQWILLEALGEPKIVAGEEIPTDIIAKAVEAVLKR
jgi:3-dehydroquinate synthetase